MRKNCSILSRLPTRDGYTGFGDLYLPDPKTDEPRLLEVACRTHARRHIYEVYFDTDSPRAREALDTIARLFAIEAEIRRKGPNERRAACRQSSTPILQELKTHLDATLAKISGKSTLAGAIRYATSRWKALTRFIDDGRLEMSNNVAERAIRPVAMRESLCIPSSSICKHWKRVFVDDATRATFTGNRRFNRLQRQIFGADLMRRARNHLYCWKRAGFDQASYRVVCDA